MPPKEKQQVEPSLPDALQKVQKETEIVQQRLSKKAKGEFIHTSRVKNNSLICSKDDKGCILPGIVIVVGKTVRVVRNKNKMRTTTAGEPVWRVDDIPMTSKGKDYIDSTDFKSIDHMQILLDFENEINGEYVDQKDIASGLFICFTNAKNENFCGYAFENGSNTRVVCRDKDTKPLHPGTVFQFHEPLSTEKGPGDFVDEDFNYDEETVRDAFRFKEFDEMTREMSTLLEKLKMH